MTFAVKKLSCEEGLVMTAAERDAPRQDAVIEHPTLWNARVGHPKMRKQTTFGEILRREIAPQDDSVLAGERQDATSYEKRKADRSALPPQRADFSLRGASHGAALHWGLRSGVG